VAGLPLLHMEEPELTGTRRILKTALDRSVATATLPVLSPTFLLIAVAIAATSRGRVFFR